MVDIEKSLNELGHEVVLPSFTHEYAKMETIDKIDTESARNKIEQDLIRGYYNKIKDGDAIVIANVERKEVEGYVGGNSFLEMGFAYVLNKPIYLLNKIPSMGYTDEIKAMEPIVLAENLKK
jgi:nucleoside 2-deoxyribosyltransferase